MADTVNGRTGYRDRSAPNGARFVRPEGEPSWFVGSALVLAVFGVGALLFIAATGG